jgi:hypothetical protein
MLIVALVLAVIGLAALVTAVVTSNEMIAWVCIGASVIGVLLLIVDALRERSRIGDGADGSETADDADVEGRDDETTIIPAVSEAETTEDYPDDPTEIVDEDETTAAHESNTVESSAVESNTVESNTVESNTVESSAVESNTVESDEDDVAETKRD